MGPAMDAGDLISPMATGILNIVDGNDGAERVTLDHPFIVGRDEAGSGSLAGRELSRRHARFYPVDNGEFVVEDLDSTNGTQVNGKRISAPHVPVPGDRLAVGRTVLQFDREVAAMAGSATVVVAHPQQARESTPPPAPPAAPAASAPPSSAIPPARSYGFDPVPPGGGRRTGSGRRGLAILLAVLVLLGGGFGIGYAVNNNSAATKTVAKVGVLDASGHPSTAGFTCAPDDNGHTGAGHFRFLTSACEDAQSLIAQLPLHQGTSGGQTVYYVVTESSNKADAAARHVNYSPKLANAIGTRPCRTSR